jgi:hypothetical protein
MGYWVAKRPNIRGINDMIRSMGMIGFVRGIAIMHDRVIDSKIDSNIDSRG